MRIVYLIMISLLSLVGCESAAPTAPPVTAAMIRPGARQHMDPSGLTSGRTAFLGHCVRCHALPDVMEHSAERWPAIVAKMTKRSGLQAEEAKNVLAYILAARETATR